MNEDEVEYWNKVLGYLATKTNLHLWYSIKEGWCWISTKKDRFRITFKQSFEEIKKML